MLGKKYDMKINTKKTKTMKFSRTNDTKVKIKIDGEEIENVAKFRYLGALINEDGRDTKEIRSRIGMAKQAFNNLGNVLKNRTLSIDLRKRVMRCYVWTVLKYSCETWTMNVESEKKLNAFEMWCYRRLLKIPWTDFVTNATVLEKEKRRKKYSRGYQEPENEIYSPQNSGKWRIHVGSTGKNPRQTHQRQEKSGVDNDKLAQ